MGLLKRAAPSEVAVSEYLEALPLYRSKKELVLEYFKTLDKDGDGVLNSMELRGSAMYDKAIDGWEVNILANILPAN